MTLWLKKFLLSPASIGSVIPSSDHIARIMAARLPSEGRLLELGPGTGIVTKHILTHAPTATLELVESDAEFVQYCTQAFPRAHTYQGNAEDFLKNSSVQYDGIVSCIPFLNMDIERRHRFFSLIKDRLAPGGVFVMIQYIHFLSSKNDLIKEFGSVRTDFTLWNLPPAFVYTAKKQ